MGGDHADRLANVHRAARCQVTSVTFHAAAAARLAREHRTNPNALHAGALNLSRQIFVDFLVGLDNARSFNRIDNIFERRAANDTITQAFNLFDCTGRDALQRAAVLLADDYILRHINQPSRQIAGVGCLQRRVRQTFARAVSRNEVLQHVESFAEIRLNRGLDNFTRRPCH